MSSERKKHTYVLVHWESENCYSSVQRKKVVSGLSDDEIIGLKLPIIWNKQEEPQFGIIINVGSKSEMQSEENLYVQAANELSFEREELEGVEIAEHMTLRRSSRKRSLPYDHTVSDSNANKTKTLKVTERGGFCESQVDALASVNGPDAADHVENRNTDQLIESPAKQIEVGKIDTQALLKEKNEAIRKLELKLAKSQQQNRVFKKLIKNREPSDKNEDNVEMESIGPGVSVPKDFMDYLRISYKTRPSQFFRQLIFESGLFDLNEVANCSLNGKWINRPQSGRPGLDVVRLNAAKACTILHCGLKSDTLAMKIFETKLATVCTDARKAVKRREAKAQAAENVAE